MKPESGYVAGAVSYQMIPALNIENLSVAMGRRPKAVCKITQKVPVGKVEFTPPPGAVNVTSA